MGKPLEGLQTKVLRRLVRAEIRAAIRAAIRAEMVCPFIARQFSIHTKKYITMKKMTEEQEQVLIFVSIFILIMCLAVAMFYAGFQAGKNL